MFAIISSAGGVFVELHHNDSDLSPRVALIHCFISFFLIVHSGVSGTKRRNHSSLCLFQFTLCFIHTLSDLLLPEPKLRYLRKNVDDVITKFC